MELCSCSYKKESSRNWNYNTCFDDLPDGLVFDILSRLPVKTLVQSICVCKLWYVIIKTPSFISAHLSRSISNPSSYYIFISHYYSLSVTVISDNPLLIRHPDLKFTFETLSTYRQQLIGGCKGLICVTDICSSTRGRDIYLINPFIHKYKRLGVECSCYADLIGERETNGSGYAEGQTIDINIAFGYSELVDDYKVLRLITHLVDAREHVYADKIEIYSLKSGKWKALDLSFAIELRLFAFPTSMHGCLYWHDLLLCRYGGEDYLHGDKYLLCFDLKDELFSRIELPKTYSRLAGTWHSGVFVKNGSLAIVLCTKDREGNVPLTRICLLVLEKKSGGQIRWEEFNYVCADFDPIHCIGFGAMGLCGRGRLLFVEHAESNLLPGYILAVDLDNSCAIERLALDISDMEIHEATHVSESLVFLSD